jgi:uncharacterized protein (UPF0333 family)
MEVIMRKVIADIKQFIEEEQAQVSIEYFLLVGAAVVAAIMAASSYRKMSYASEMKYIEEIQDTYDTLCSYVETHLGIYTGAEVEIACSK